MNTQYYEKIKTGIQKAIINPNGHDFISSSLSVKNPKEITATVKEILLNLKAQNYQMPTVLKYLQTNAHLLLLCFSKIVFIFYPTMNPLTNLPS